MLKCIYRIIETQKTNSLSGPLNLLMNDQVLFRLYQDSRPHCLEVAPLQKGLVLVFDGKELIEEGIGFGVPVVKYKNKTYFSSSAHCYTHETENGFSLSKLFVLDTISRKLIGKSFYVNDGLYRSIHRLFEKLYLGNNQFFPFFSKLMELRKVMGIQTKFIKVEPMGSIEVEFSIKAGSIKVHVDLSGLDKVGCEKIFLLNEQGSTFFDGYKDSDGNKLSGTRIGAWTEVRAADASLSCTKCSLEFSLEKLDKSLLFRGWEKTIGRFAWTGLSYALPPQLSFFEYVIILKNTMPKIEGLAQVILS
jgi:hypothetical protein